MIVQLITRTGPLRIEASQILVENNEGTPIMVAGEFGPPGCQKIAKVGDDDFQRTLEVFGYGRHEIIVEDLKPPAVPAGAKLLTRPE